MKKTNEKILVSALAGMTALQGMSTTLMSVCAQENDETTHVSVMNVKMSQKDELESKLNDSKKDVDEKTLALDSAKGALSVASKQVEILESKQDEKVLTPEEEIKKLKKELEMVKLENEYLKKLAALVQARKDQQQQKK